MSTQDPLNTAPIQNFINTVKGADASQAKEVKLTMQQAKGLAFTLGLVMARLQGDMEKFMKENASKEEAVEVQMDGGNNWYGRMAKRNKLERKLDEYNHTMELIRTIVPIAVLVLQVIILMKIL